MKLFVLVVALMVGMSGGCKKRKDDDGPYSGGGNPTVYGAEQGVRGAVQRTVTQAEMHDLHLFMTNAKLTLGRVPTKQETWAALSRPDGNPKLTQLVQEGLIYLVDNPQDEGLWAYDKNAPTTGGIILTHSGVERVTAQDFNSRFGQR